MNLRRATERLREVRSLPLLLLALLLWPALPGHTAWAWLTLAYPVGYVALSFWLGGFARSGRR